MAVTCRYRSNTMKGRSLPLITRSNFHTTPQKSAACVNSHPHVRQNRSLCDICQCIRCVHTHCICTTVAVTPLELFVPPDFYVKRQKIEHLALLALFDAVDSPIVHVWVTVDVSYVPLVHHDVVTFRIVEWREWRVAARYRGAWCSGAYKTIHWHSPVFLKSLKLNQCHCPSF